MPDSDQPKGLLGRVRRRARRAVTRVRDGVKQLNEEARHPGRPPSYHAAASPYWQDDDMVMPAETKAAEQASPPAAPPTADDDGLPKPTDRTDRDGEPFWFLEGEDDLEGWEQTNPSEQWRERHGVDGNE